MGLSPRAYTKRNVSDPIAPLVIFGGGPHRSRSSIAMLTGVLAVNTRCTSATAREDCAEIAEKHTAALTSILIKSQERIDPVLHHLACRVGAVELEADQGVLLPAGDCSNVDRGLVGQGKAKAKVV